MIEKVGYFLGKLVKSEEGLEGLKRGFEKFFGELKEFHDFDFSSELGDKLVTRSKCPVYKHFGIWCERYCLEFAKGFAKAYGIEKVERIERQPKNDYCVFEFEK